MKTCVKNWMAAALLAAALCLNFGNTAQAGASTKDDVSAFIDSVAKQALSIVANKNSDRAERQRQLQSMFEQHVDVNWIAQFVLGRSWKTTTEEQKARYLATYRTFLVKNYTGNFEDFTDAKYEIVRTEEAGKPNEYTTTMKLKRPGQQDIIVQYRLRAEDKGGFKVIDIIAEGISLINSQRSEFSSVVSRNGIDYLIERIEEKVKG